MICIQVITGNHPRNLPKDPEVIWSKEVVSPELAAILDKMVCSDFSQRYQSATEVLQALKDKNRILTVPTHKLTILSGLKSLLKGFKF